MDREVARHIFQECVCKLLRGKTRIVVTQLDDLLQSFDRVIRMHEGRIVTQGKKKETSRNIDKNRDFLIFASMR